MVALAAVLADLAKTHQVIVVTHLAQVAMRGERHFMVKKTAGAAPNESEDANAAEAAIPETTLCELMKKTNAFAKSPACFQATQARPRLPTQRNALVRDSG